LTELKRFSLVKPTLNTRFHIDFGWWAQSERDWRVDLRSFLCPRHQQTFSGVESECLIDCVDAETAEVRRVDGLQHVLIHHCAKQEGFITSHTTLVDAVLRIFLANGNTPLSPNELAEQLNRPPQTILSTLASGRVYQGIRPCPG
jgi:hypothetical protein